jgi:AraC-like DNA-binding protein
MFCLAVAAFFVTSKTGARDLLGAPGYLLTALCVTKAAWFWLLSRSLFNDSAFVQGRHVVVVSAVAVAGTWQQAVFLPAFRSGTAGFLETAAGFGVECGLLLLVLVGVYEAWRGFGPDLVEQRRRLRVAFIAATGAYLIATLVVQTGNLVLGISTPVPARLMNMLVATASFLAAGWFLVQARSESWLDPATEKPVVALNRIEAAVMAKLQQALDEDSIFLEEGLTIGGLAAHLGASEHVLRGVINRGMGYRNFNDFLHARRIREACEELSRPEQARLPVLSIAMKVGYGSVGAFNRAFKARIGMTPTAFRQSAVNGATHSRG